MYGIIVVLKEPQQFSFSQGILYFEGLFFAAAKVRD